MQTYRFRPDVLFQVAEGNKDLGFIREAYKRGLFYRSIRGVNFNNGEFTDEQIVYVNEKDEKIDMKVYELLLGKEGIKELTGQPYIAIKRSVLKTFFEPVPDGEIADLDTFVPEVSITDDQYRREAVRACIFMEHNVKDGLTPVKAENVSGDKGGLTKYGISKAAFPNLDIASLTYDDAVKIYEEKMWVDCKADELPRPLNALTFDLRVTSGPKNAFRVLQRAVGTQDDGIWGPKTKQAAHDACDTVPKMLAACRLFTEKRIAFYQAIVDNNPSQSKFLKGWINRAVKSQIFAQALLHTLDIL